LTFWLNGTIIKVMATKKAATRSIAGRRSAQLFLVAVTLAVVGWLLLSKEGLLRQSQDKALPKVKVSAWENKAAVPAVTQSVKTYGLKHDFSRSDLKAAAQVMLGNDKLEELGEALYGYSWGAENENNLSAYTVNPKTGAFTYAGTKGQTLGSSGTMVEKADHFLSGLISDSTLTATATYRRHDKPGVVFVEFHRDWQKAGLPVLNALGLLNLDENQKLSGLSLISRSDRTDSQVHGTSDLADGLARQTDFNSVTVGINEQANTVVSVNSNLRQLKDEDPRLAKLVPYGKALSSLTANKYDFMYTSPTGSGTPSFDKVYPDNNVTVKRAVIDEALVAYLEEPPGVSQSKLEPYYIFKGTAELESGYNAKFVAGVVASEGNRLAWWPGRVAKAESGAGGSTGIPTTTPPPPPPTPPPPPVVCIPSVSDLTNIRNVSPGVNVGQLKTEAVARARATGDNARAGDWYMYPTTGALTAADVITALEALQREFPDVNDRNPARVQAELESFRNSNCPIRLTGKSPTVFVYGPTGANLGIEVGSLVSYADPGLVKRAWEATVVPGGVSVGSKMRPYLYYEYEQNVFTRPKEGWQTTVSGLPDLANKLSLALGLNSLEAERLLFELRHAAVSVGQKELFVGLADNGEVNAKLPLKVEPFATVERLHFYVGARGSSEVEEPVLNPVARSGLMILEIGAAGDR
jgi:hypothetical protein